MNEEEALAFAAEAIFALLQLAAPVMIVGLLVGLSIALFQALTQIQEITLTFVPKIIVVFLSLLVFLPFMLDILQTFMANVVKSEKCWINRLGLHRLRALPSGRSGPHIRDRAPV